MVGLIIPPSRFLLDERVFPQLGVLSVAASLESQGIPVEVLDLAGVENFVEAARIYASSSEARLFGITATTPQMPAAEEIRKTLRAVRPDAELVLGGPHATLLHASHSRLGVRTTAALARLKRNWDHIVAGDGEKAMVMLANGSFLGTKNQVLDADDPVSWLWSHPGERGFWPARHLIDLEGYKYTIEGAKATSVISQLGCPFKCNFCAGRLSPSYRRLRARPVDDVIREIEWLHQTHNFTGFMFYDDELNVTPRMMDLMHALVELQERLGVEFRLRGFVKSELFTKEQAEVMFRAGFRWILAGFESGSDEILTNIDKQASVRDNDRCMEIARATGLKVKALMSIGHAGESPATCQETEDWLISRRPDDFDVTIITVYPGTAYHDDALLDGDHYTFTHPVTGAKLHSFDIDHTTVADYYKGDPVSCYTPHVFTDFLEASRIREIRNRIESNVRSCLGIAWNQPSSQPAFRYEGGPLPPHILRSSSPA